VRATFAGMSKALVRRHDVELSTNDFDLGALPAGVRRKVAERTLNLHALNKTHVNVLLDIGHELLQVQKLLKPYRVFGKWLRSEFGWSESTAYNYMRVMRALDTVGRRVENLQDLQATTLYALTHRAVPHVVREDILCQMTDSDMEMTDEEVLARLMRAMEAYYQPALPAPSSPTAPAPTSKAIELRAQFHAHSEIYLRLWKNQRKPDVLLIKQQQLQTKSEKRRRALANAIAKALGDRLGPFLECVCGDQQRTDLYDVIALLHEQAHERATLVPQKD
jgi:hypothetical protein